MLKEVPEGKSVSFAYRDEYGLLAEGFVFCKSGQYYAYRNQCRHQPLTLDYGDGEFFTEDGNYLLCRNHGALYEPTTGLCIAGPCAGASLFEMKAELAEDGVRIYALKESSDLELE